MSETAISTVNLSGGSQHVTKSMPAIWKIEGQANKQGGVQQYWDKAMIVSIITLSNSQPDYITAGKCVWEHRDHVCRKRCVRASFVPKNDAHIKMKTFEKYCQQQI